MGTRCLITAEGSQVVLFRHWDGYPEGVLPELEPIVSAFFAIRGQEPDMLLANVCQKLRNEHEKDKIDWLGYRLFSRKEATHIGDTEYLYFITSTGGILVLDGDGGLLANTDKKLVSKKPKIEIKGGVK